MKLTWPIVRAMRAEHAECPWGSKSALKERQAREYGICQATVTAVWSHAAWPEGMVPAPSNNLEHRSKRDQQLEMIREYLGNQEAQR